AGAFRHAVGGGSGFGARVAADPRRRPSAVDGPSLHAGPVRLGGRRRRRAVRRCLGAGARRFDPNSGGLVLRRGCALGGAAAGRCVPRARNPASRLRGHSRNGHLRPVRFGGAGLVRGRLPVSARHALAAAGCRGAGVRGLGGDRRRLRRQRSRVHRAAGRRGQVDRHRGVGGVPHRDGLERPGPGPGLRGPRCSFRGSSV
ncbi:MAG: hypothetical protein AVDCRST_MAG89-2240, partial [uncultured Gemmatimonadetes bacterium]